MFMKCTPGNLNMQCSSDVILDIKNLSCGYGGKPVIEDFNLQVRYGECVAIIGPNGSGKSTLLKAIQQLCIVNFGTIIFMGKTLNGLSPEQVKQLGVAYFMQKNAIFRNLSIKENLVLSLNGSNKPTIRRKIDEIVALFPDIAEMLTKTAGLLSGGQRQQLAMAMLLSQNASLWLIDEFSAGLDSEKLQTFLDQIFIHGQNIVEPKTIIFVEHKKEIIKQLSDRIITMKGSEHEF